MKTALDQFKLNIKEVRELDAIYDFLENHTTDAFDFSNILRSEIVLLVSALDCYIHDLVRICMVEIYLKGEGTETSAFKNFPISMECVMNIANSNTDELRANFLHNEIRRLNGYKAFQEPEKISHALSCIGLRKVWEEVGKKLNCSATDVKERLQLIIEQRNRIVHEADFDPTPGTFGGKRRIDQVSTKETVNFVEKLCEELFSIASNVNKKISNKTND